MAIRDTHQLSEVAELVPFGVPSPALDLTNTKMLALEYEIDNISFVNFEYSPNGADWYLHAREGKNTGLHGELIGFVPPYIRLMAETANIVRIVADKVRDRARIQLTENWWIIG